MKKVNKIESKWFDINVTRIFEIINANQSDIFKIPNFVSINSSAYCERSLHQPNNLKNLNEIKS